MDILGLYTCLVTCSANNVHESTISPLLLKQLFTINKLFFIFS